MPERTMSWLNLSGRQRLPVVRQSTFADCGLACIAMIAAYFGSNVDLAGLRRRFGASLAGASLANLVHTAESLHLSTRAVRCSLAELACLPQPCILHWGFDHFVVLRKAHRSHLLIHDPAGGALKVSLAEADAKFTGVALELTPDEAFASHRPARRLKLTDLIMADSGFWGGMSSALLLALVSELLLLATPFYLQTVIDQVLMRGDHALLHTLALGFALLAVFQLAASVLRQLTFQFLSQSTMFSLSSRVLRHLMHLPVSWFRARRTGDVQHRMQSLAGVQAFVTQSAPALLIDCVFLLIVVVLMFFYAPALTFIAGGATVAYVLWRILVFPLMLELTNKVVRAEAAAQSHLLESLRGMQSIKMCAGEAYRLRDWRNLLAHRINTQIRAGNLGIIDSAVHQGVFQGLHIVIVFLLAQRVQAGEMSVGTLSAFVAYSGMFVTRAGGITNRIFEYHLLRVPLGRLEDIVFNDVKTPHCEEEHPRLIGTVRASGLKFSYPGANSAVLDNVTFDVARGELIAVHGRSGGGKSTLLRLLGGIEQPVAGELCYDGKPVTDWPQGRLRRDIATVFHDDVLLSGSIADNIALFDPERDDQRIREVAGLAAVGGAVEALPMAYETPIGDLGSVLSAGQVQRLLFARALYRRPSLLLLDEFTSALDADTERRVLQSLLRLPVTRIVVSHSSAVLRAADRVYELRDGRLKVT
jgi:ATP-binding cassette subfamily B protein RaxB